MTPRPGIEFSPETMSWKENKSCYRCPLPLPNDKVLPPERPHFANDAL